MRIAHMSKNERDNYVSQKELTDAKAALGYTTRLLFHRHRGILDLDDKFVIFENGRYDYSKIAGEMLQARLSELGWRFSFAGDLYWAAVVFDYSRSRSFNEIADILGAVVADAKDAMQQE